MKQSLDVHGPGTLHAGGLNFKLTGDISTTQPVRIRVEDVQQKPLQFTFYGLDGRPAKYEGSTEGYCLEADYSPVGSVVARKGEMLSKDSVESSVGHHSDHIFNQVHPCILHSQAPRWTLPWMPSRST